MEFDLQRPILCLDFDGVLHWYRYGWHGADVVDDEPVPGAVKFVKQAIKHFKVMVYSSRSHQPGGIEAMVSWMADHGFPIPAIDFPTVKPPASITIDDRAILFTGVFPDMDTLVRFRPWNKDTMKP